ncbi:MAG: hypothetical protein WEG36_15010 [Gemmatimonadota bacterium]
MTKKDEKILALMETELGKNPKAATQDLFDKAKAIDSAVGKLSLRQFHARYPLQIKRRRKRGRPRRKVAGVTRRRGRSAAKSGRDGLRAVFLRFAEDLTAAEDRRNLVKVLANVDQYVDDAVKAARA